MRSLLFTVLTAALVLTGAACGKKTTTTNTPAANTSTAVVSNVSVPTAGTTGTFSGKLDTLVLTTSDLPTNYGPYAADESVPPGYLKVESGDADTVLQQYDAGTVDNSDVTFTISTNVTTYKDTAGAATAYNLETAAIRQVSLDDAATYGNFTGIGDASFYQASTLSLGLDRSVDETMWTIKILKSNLSMTISLTAPVAYTTANVQSLLSKIATKMSAYVPATASQLQQENASAT